LSFSVADFNSGFTSNTISRHYRDTVSDMDLYPVNFAAELLCLRDSSYVLIDDVVFSKDEVNDFLSTALCD